MSDSRISGLYRLPVRERIDELERSGWLSSADADALKNGRHVLSVQAADRMIENVIGTFALPFAIAPNFRVNDRDYIVPLVVEEPSIVAALSAAALAARHADGFTSSCDASLLIGQVHLTDIDDVASARDALMNARTSLLARANEVHPRLSERGGGVRDIEVRELQMDDGVRSIAVHLLVDTCDAMGANLVNTICEAVAPEMATLCEANVAMSILSNLADQSMVTADVRFRLEDLGKDEAAAVRARDAIVMAAAIARVDPYRAATHNKGIMNGIDALAISTGNDWRAIEAGAHAHAAAGGRYSSLTRWWVDDGGDLAGEIRVPLKVGIVGGTLDTNPAASAGLRMTGVNSAVELAELMAAVGLAQNYAAIRALATEGIQRGHMRLHARSVVAAAGAPDEAFDEIVDELVASGQVKDWKAREIVAARQAAGRPDDAVCAAGKVILLGEHAAVYGKHALALPIVDAVSAAAQKSEDATIDIPEWGIRTALAGTTDNALARAVSLIAHELDIGDSGFSIQVNSSLPRAMGLGSSAAIAVAITRALARLFERSVDDERVNAIAFECEKLAHGSPSGVDNTISTYATPMMFVGGDSPEVRTVELLETPPVVIGCGHTPGNTIEQVAGVRTRWTASPDRYDALFAEIDAISVDGADALRRSDYTRLGKLMNICHGLLNAIEVSTPELEHMVSIARANGAVGAKLTGAGGGGSIVALCPGRVSEVTAALAAAGYRTMRPDDHRDSARG